MLERAAQFRCYGFSMMAWKLVIAAALILVGLAAAGVGFLGLLDPVGAKAADDSDPFGKPPSRSQGMAVTCAGLAISGGGVAIGAKAVRRYLKAPTAQAV